MKPYTLPPEVAWEALNHTSDIVLCLDGRGDIIYANEAANLVLGYGQDELTGKSIFEISPDLTALPELGGTDMNGSSNFHSNLNVKGNGSSIPVEVSLVSFRLNNKTYFWAFARNITLRTMAEDALRQSEGKFRGAFHDAAVGMAIFTPEGYFSEVNPFLCETLGYTEGEFKKFHFLDITHPDDIESSVLHDSIIRDGKVPFAYHEKRYLHKNGDAVWFIASDSLIRDESGNPQYILTHYQNITKRKEIERALRAGEERFRLFMENLPGMAFIKDRAGRYVFGNSFLERRIKISGLDGIAGLTDNEIFPPEFASRIIRNDSKVFSSGQSAEFIEKMPGPAETEEWLVCRFPITHDDGSILLGGVAIEISNLVKAQRELQEKEKQLGIQAEHLEQVNTALKVLLDHREQEKIKLEDTMITTLEKLVIPYLQEARGGSGNEINRTYINIAISNLKDIAAPFASRLTSPQTQLSPAELRVADLLRHGKTSFEIADLLAISPYTVARHRESIRRKLGLVNKKINLQTYLQTAL